VSVGISAQQVKDLREKTGVGMMECKKALQEADGNVENAIKRLRERGMARATKRAGRATREGMIHAYIHPGSRIGVLVEVNCETDFVARTDEFAELVKDIAMQVAASSPLCVLREEVPESVISAEKEIYYTQAEQSGKPEKILDKIVEGKLNDFYSKVCLMEQTFIKDQKKTISDLLQEKISQTGENISIRRFTLYRLGED